MEDSKSILETYCKIKGISPQEITVKKRDAKTVIVRDSLIFLTWKNASKKINYKNKKSKVLTQIAEVFDMKRNSVHERIKRIENELKIYGNIPTLEEISNLLNIRMNE